MTDLLRDFRCYRCGKLLARYQGHIEVKCPRCKTVQTGNTIECQSKESDGEERVQRRGDNPALR
jgi:phage FluMu protein Com